MSLTSTIHTCAVANSIDRTSLATTNIPICIYGSYPDEDESRFTPSKPAVPWPYHRDCRDLQPELPPFSLSAFRSRAGPASYPRFNSVLNVLVPFAAI